MGAAYTGESSRRRRRHLDESSVSIYRAEQHISYIPALIFHLLPLEICTPLLRSQSGILFGRQEQATTRH